MGRRFERWLDSEVLSGELLLGQWFEFEDANGTGHAQPDVLLIQPKLVLIGEVKLTQTNCAVDQLKRLYYHIVQEVYQRDCVLLQICKNLRTEPARSVSHPRELLESPRLGVWTWHWLGRG